MYLVSDDSFSRLIYFNNKQQMITISMIKLKIDESILLINCILGGVYTFDFSFLKLNFTPTATPLGHFVDNSIGYSVLKLHLAYYYPTTALATSL